MQDFSENQEDLARLFFRAKAAAYTSPMAIRGWQEAGRTDFVLVDVRKAAPPPTTRIPGSLWIPENELAQRADELPRDKLLVLYCWDTWCSLATSAALVLLDRGYRVKELNGGIAAWQGLRLPEVDTGAERRGSVSCAC